MILRSLDQKDPLVSVLHGPTLAKARERPDLQATASAADPLDFCSLVDLCFLCYSMLPCDCDCRGCCGCRMFCWRVECCCCCCRAVVVAVVVIVLVFFSMLLLLFLWCFCFHSFLLLSLFYSFLLFLIVLYCLLLYLLY